MTTNTPSRFPDYQRVVWTGDGWTPSEAPVPHPALAAWRPLFAGAEMRVKSNEYDQMPGAAIQKHRLAPRPQPVPDYRPRQCGNR